MGPIEYKVVGDYNRTPEKTIGGLMEKLEHESTDGWEFVSEITRWVQGSPSYYMIFKRMKAD